MKKAIITFAVGYEFEDIRYFIQSCRINTPESDLFIFVGDNIDDLKFKCSIFPGVHLIRYKEHFLAKVIGKIFLVTKITAVKFSTILRHAYRHHWLPTRVLCSLTLPMVQFMVKRFFLIRDLIENLPHEQIMLTDIRDVLLLSDPFQGLQEDVILSGIEPVTIEQSEMNGRWIKLTYSEEVYGELKNKPVICAGVTIGSRKAIDQYIYEMIKETYNQLPSIISMLGADQAIHMKLFFTGLSGLKKGLQSNGEGSIATLHFSKLDEFNFKNGNMQNKKGQTLAVVHQYDRHERLVDYLKGFIVSKQVNVMAS